MKERAQSEQRRGGNGRIPGLGRHPAVRRAGRHNRNERENGMLTRTPVDLPDPTRPVSEQEPLLLLAMCIFGEARGESELARRAVAQVVLNRAKYPRPPFGSRKSESLEENVRAVILQPQQFSSLNPCDPNYAGLLHPLQHELPQVWERCVHCAEAALANKDADDTLTMNSDHYFDDSIQPPAWASPAKRTVKIGALNFYRLYLPRPTGNANTPTTRVLTPRETAPAPNLAAAEPQKLTRAELAGSPPATVSPARRGDSPAPGPNHPRPDSQRQIRDSGFEIRDSERRIRDSRFPVPESRRSESPLVSHPAPKSLRAHISGPGTYLRYDRSRGLSLHLANGERRVASGEDHAQQAGRQEEIGKRLKAIAQPVLRCWKGTGGLLRLSAFQAGIAQPVLRCWKGTVLTVPGTAPKNAASAAEGQRSTSGAKAHGFRHVCGMAEAMPLRRSERVLQQSPQPTAHNHWLLATLRSLLLKSYSTLANRQSPLGYSLSLLALIIVTTGCSDFERNAYRVLAVTQAEYETTQQRVAEAAVHGLIDEEQWTRFQVEGHRFIAAHNAAVDAFALWSQAKSQSNSVRLQATLEVLPRLITEINALVASFEEQPAQPPRDDQPSALSDQPSAKS